MSAIRSFQAPHNDYNQLQYTQYLQDQLEKFSSFILYQKKENQKNNQLMRMIEDQNQKIKIMNDKIQLFEIYQHQNFKSHSKMLDFVQKVPILEKKLEKLQIILHETKYDSCQSSKPSKSHIIKNELEEMIAYEISQKFKQIQEIIDLKQERLVSKISSISKQKQANTEQRYAVRKIDQSRNICFSKNSTALRTNQTQHQGSRIKQIESIDLINKKWENQNQKRISSFAPEQFNKLEKEFQINQNRKKIKKSAHSFTDRDFNEKRPRSPISSYLEKEKDFNSQKQNINTNNHTVFKSFYSVLQKPNAQAMKNKKNEKTKKSKSKSEIKSERSQSSSCISKLKKNNKYKHLLNEQKSHLARVGKNHHKKQSKQVSKERKKSKKANKMKSFEKSNNNSQLSLSRNSIKSGSHSRGSIPKQFKNQKQYLMYCNKLHY